VNVLFFVHLFFWCEITPRKRELLLNCNLETKMLCVCNNNNSRTRTALLRGWMAASGGKQASLAAARAAKTHPPPFGV
jgi:hypothetical protein